MHNIPEPHWPLFAHGVAVTVEVEAERKDTTGSGIIFTADGDILTSLHALEGESEIKVRRFRLVRRKGRSWRIVNIGKHVADVVLVDRVADLAVLKMRKPPKTLSVAVLGTAYQLKPGAPVFRVGRSEHDKLASGHVLSIGTPKLKPEESSDDLAIISMSMPCEQGSSGGPVFDPEGRVVGVALKVDDEEWLPPKGHALPIDFAKSGILWRWMRQRHPAIAADNAIIRKYRNE